MQKIRAVSLFSGCGGMDLGFEGGFKVHRSSVPVKLIDVGAVSNQRKFVELPSTNIETVFACDVNGKAHLAWDNFMENRRNISGVYREESVVDIVKRIKKGSLGALEDMDIVTGGFPCNDFSVAGKRLGFDSNKSHRGNHSVIDSERAGSILKTGVEPITGNLIILTNDGSALTSGIPSVLILNDGSLELPLKMSIDWIEAMLPSLLGLAQLNLIHFVVPASRYLIPTPLSTEFLNFSAPSNFTRETPRRFWR